VLSGEPPAIDDLINPVVGHVEATVAFVGGGNAFGGTVAELVQHLSFPVLRLAVVLGEVVRPESPGETSEPSSCIDGGELGRVTDEDDLGLPASGADHESFELAGADHAGFVNHDHVVRSKIPTAGAQVDEEPVKGGRRDAAAVLELLGSSSSEGASHDPSP
jgi:hypothetical protein